MTSSKTPVAGLVYVPMAIKEGVTVQEIDDWYNNEHVPIRMRLPYFQNGFRYRATDDQQWQAGPAEEYKWLALYDLSDMWGLQEERYERLLTPAVQSSRENGIIGHKVSAFRKYWDLVSTYEAPGYVPLEEEFRRGNHDEAFGRQLIVVGVKLVGNAPENEKEWNRWYEEDHLPPLRKVPGWLRTRRFRTSITEDGEGEVEFLTLNEFAKVNAIGGPEHQIAIKSETKTQVVGSKWRRNYKLHYVQGKASRDLGALQRENQTLFISPDSLTRTISGSWPVIESYVVLNDQAILRYRLEGTGTQNALLIVLLTVDGLPWTVWDSVVASLKSGTIAEEYRILRLRLPTRLRDVDESLENLTSRKQVSLDLETTFKALLIHEAAAIFGIVCRGPTAQDSSKGILKLSRESFGPALPQICKAGLFVVAKGHDDLNGALQTFQTGLDEVRSVGEWTQEVSITSQ